MRAKMFKILN